MATKKRSMIVIALAASKGGVGKSTLTAALAVRAAREARVAVVDHDPQLSLSQWWDRRGAPSNPQLYEDVESSTDAIKLISDDGFDYLFIDTPPSQINLMEMSVACADFVLIPTRAGIMDIDAVRLTEELCRQHQKPFAFILNMVMANGKATAAAASYLRSGRRTLIEPNITLRQSYSDAMWKGATGPELKDLTAHKEIDELWASTKKALSKALQVPA